MSKVEMATWVFIIVWPIWTFFSVKLFKEFSTNYEYPNDFIESLTWFGKFMLIIICFPKFFFASMEYILRPLFKRSAKW